jgi:hypothetical protein
MSEQQLLARLHGLEIILSMVLHLLPEDEVLRRLKMLEEMARQRNMESETIAVLREFRENWEK